MMQLASVLATAAVLAIASTGTAAADPHAAAASTVEKLRDLERIEPAAVAKLLGGKLGKTVDVTDYRHETPFTLDGYRDARVVVGGKDNAWRIVTLEPDPALGLVLADVTTPLAKLPHSAEPRGPHMPGTTHRYHAAHHDLLVNLDDHDKLTSIILTTEIAK